MNNIQVRVLLLSLVVPISTGALAEADSSEIIEEIVVTATRRETPIMKITQSIQAITQDQLELPTFNDLNKVYNLVPGATIHSNKPPAKEGIHFRGSGISSSGADDGQSPVGYYVDDIPYVDISTPVPPPIGTFDLERIEIIRGPQGTSYGQDSSAGSVIMRTNPVDLQNFGFKVRTGLSNVSGVDGSGYTIGGVVNIPIAEDVFGIRLSYLREEDPGYGEVVGRPDIDNPLKNTRDSIRVKAFWNVNDWLSLELTHSEWNTEFGVLPGTQISDSSGGEMLLNDVSTEMLLALFPDGELRNNYEVSWTTLLAKFDLGFAELTSATGFVDSPKKETNSEFEFDLGWGPIFAAVVFNQPAESLTQEFRLVSTADSKLQWIAGVFFLDAESNSAGFTQTPAFFVMESISDPIDADAWAVYGEIEYAINDQWSVQAGLRHHDEERKYTTHYALGFTGEPMFGPYSLPSPVTVEKSSFDHTSYRLGVTWKPSEDGIVYLTQSTASRAPIILPQSERMQLEAAGIEPIGGVDAAELINTEIGTKWMLLDGRMQFEVVYAHGNWKDVPLWAEVRIPPTPVAMAIGGTDAVVESYEMAVTWVLTDNLTFNYAGAYTDTEVKDTPSQAEVAGYPPAVHKGGELYNYSPWTHNLGINYNQTLANGWEVFASANYVTRDKADGINAFDLTAVDFASSRDKYVNLAIDLGVTRGAWTYAFSVNNATDDDGMYEPGTEILVNGLIPAPRTYYLQLTYDAM